MVRLFVTGDCECECEFWILIDFKVSSGTGFDVLFFKKKRIFPLKCSLVVMDKVERRF